MAGQVKLPLIGEVNKNVAYGVGLAGAGIGAILYIRYRKNAATAQQNAATATVTDPAGNQCTQVNPSTGYCPGSPEDQAASAQTGLEGYGALDGGGGVGYGTFPTGTGSLCPDGSYPTGYDQYGNPICPQGTSSPTATTPVTTNDEWLQEVQAQYPGWATALRGVLGGLTVTTAEKNQFLEAVGIFGAPPQGYPTPIKTSDTGGHPGPPPANTVTVPNVVGDRAITAEGKIRAAGLSPEFTSPPAQSHANYVATQSPKGGTKADKGSKVTMSLSAKKP